MRTIVTEGLTKVYDGLVAVDDVNLRVEPGEFVALLGPTGCGKSTLLRMVAGLEEPTSGRVLIDGQPVEPGGARDSRVAMVFHDYALYPHLTVADNIGFPLRGDPDPALDVPARVAEIAAHLGIADVLRRRPDRLSGGQRRRVAMARAIARRPDVLLLDEPLSDLDAGLRAELRTEVVAVARRLGTTTLYVTHDQVEAMTMADRVAVLRRGRLQQIGPPAQVYADPRTLFVAAFLGTPRPSLLQAAVYVEADRVLVDFGSQVLELPRDDPRTAPLVRRHNDRLTVAVRADALTPLPPGTPDRLALRGRVRSVENLGHEALVHVDTGALPTSDAESGLEHPDPGRHLADVLAEDPPTGQALRAALTRMLPRQRTESPPATARTQYGFYPVYEPAADDEPPVSGDVVVRLPAPDWPAVGEPMALAVDLDRLLLFDHAGERIPLPHS